MWTGGGCSVIVVCCPPAPDRVVQRRGIKPVVRIFMLNRSGIGRTSVVR
jgi:hypothetical protein